MLNYTHLKSCQEGILPCIASGSSASVDILNSKIRVGTKNQKCGTKDLAIVNRITIIPSNQAMKIASNNHQN